jgi:hypothetical protein
MHIIRRLAFGLAAALCFLPAVQAQSPPPAWVRMQAMEPTAEIPFAVKCPVGFRLQRLAEFDTGDQPRIVSTSDHRKLFILLDDGGPDTGVRPSARSLVSMRFVPDKHFGLAPETREIGKVEIERDFLPATGALVAADGWLIVRSGSRLVRMRPFDADLLAKLKQDGATRREPSAAQSADKRAIEQELLAGLPSPSAGDGLLLGIDGWLYLATGPLDKPLQGWDGARVDPTGSGLVLRLKTDGSRFTEFARGLAQPLGLGSDAVGNLFAIDRLPADDMGEKGSKRTTRLVHVLAGGDYGWRADLSREQFERPGTLPSLGNLPLAAPSPLAVWRGPNLPKHLAGLVLVPSATEHAVRAVKVERSGATFAIAQEFSLLASDDKRFNPVSIAEQTDGTLLIATGPAADDGASRGALYELAWIGTDELTRTIREDGTMPAPPTDHQEQLDLARQETEPASLRAQSLVAASQGWDPAVYETCVALVSGKDVELARLAAELLADHLPADKPVQESLADGLQYRLLSAPPAVQRSLYLTLGKLGQKLDTVPEWIFEATSVTRELQADRIVFDGHVRAAEMRAGFGTELLLGNLEVALVDPNPEPDERFRLKQFVAATAEGMRTRELSDFVHRLIKDEADFFSKLDSAVQSRILTAYGNLYLEPAVKADVVAEWLAAHPQAALDVQLAAGRALVRLGTAKPQPLIKLVAALPAEERDPQFVPLLEQALKPHVVAGQPGEVDAALESLRGK